MTEIEVEKITDLNAYWVFFNPEEGEILEFYEEETTAKEKHSLWSTYDRTRTKNGTKWMQLDDTDGAKAIAITDDWRFSTVLSDYDNGNVDDEMIDRTQKQIHQIMTKTYGQLLGL